MRTAGEMARESLLGGGTLRFGLGQDTLRHPMAFPSSLSLLSDRYALDTSGVPWLKATATWPSRPDYASRQLLTLVLDSSRYGPDTVARRGTLYVRKEGEPVPVDSVHVEAEARPPGTVVGLVRERVTGRRLAGVEVSLDGTLARARTDAAGAFRFSAEEAAPGVHSVEIVPADRIAGPAQRFSAPGEGGRFRPLALEAGPPARLRRVDLEAGDYEPGPMALAGTHLLVATRERAGGDRLLRVPLAEGLPATGVPLGNETGTLRLRAHALAANGEDAFVAYPEPLGRLGHIRRWSADPPSTAVLKQPDDPILLDPVIPYAVAAYGDTVITAGLREGSLDIIAALSANFGAYHHTRGNLWPCTREQARTLRILPHRDGWFVLLDGTALRTGDVILVRKAFDAGATSVALDFHGPIGAAALSAPRDTTLEPILYLQDAAAPGTLLTFDRHLSDGPRLTLGTSLRLLAVSGGPVLDGYLAATDGSHLLVLNRALETRLRIPLPAGFAPEDLVAAPDRDRLALRSGKTLLLVGF